MFANRNLTLVALEGLLLAGAAHAQTLLATAFTYQGQLKDGGSPANGTYDLEFSLYDGEDGAAVLVAGPICVDDVQVVDGLFTAELDFGAAFGGDGRWLEIAVRADDTPGNCDTGAYTTLAPRQPLTAAPYAHFSTKPWATSGNDISYTTGNVGIGTSDPQRKLDVLAGVNTSLRVGRDGGTNLELKHFNTALTDVPGSAFGMQAIGPLHSHVVLDVQANDNEDGFYVRVPTTMQMNPTVDKTVLAVKGNGRVGIGTVSPSDPLTVNGAIRSVSGGFKYPDGSVQTTAASALAANTRTPQQISLLRWYDAIQTGQTFAVGSNPYGVAFDGANIWVTNSGSSNVTKLRASDGAYLGTFAVGSTPLGVAFDGANIWVANYFSNNVTKLRASDGAYLGTFAVGLQTSGVAFDGANIWVTNSDSGTVSKL